MLLYVVAFGLFAHGLFWGSGLAMLAMPRPWRRFWPAVAFPCGFALQSLVVWLGAYADLPGASSYAWPAEILPAGLLVIGLLARGRGALREAGRWTGIGGLAAVTLASLVAPLARVAGKGLTTASLGNCDAADYAAGARVLLDFAHRDRGGFIGLTEVVRTQGVDNFFDFWLRLNHFTPSALIALNGAIFHCQPHEITGLIPMVIAAATVPLVFWLVRAGFGFGGAGAAGLAAVYGFSPLTWYAVDQVAIGQLLAAQAIALLTWGGIALWRARFRRRAGLGLFAVLAIAWSLIWGAYNFIALVCFVPATGYVLARIFLARDARGLPRWVWGLTVPAVASAVVYEARIAGLAARFRLFRSLDIGWRIPGLSPEGWVGLVHGPSLLAFARPWRLALAAAVAALILAALAKCLRQGRRVPAAMILAGVAPLLGYGYLLWRGARLGTNASYDAYKLFSVFYPGLLPVFFAWLHPACRPLRLRAAAATALFAAIFAANLGADAGFARAMARAPFVVDRPLLQIARAEGNPVIASLNLRIPEMWDRLWANELLLRKPQYFLTDTYEARWSGPLRGEWDLMGDGVTVSLPAPDGFALGERFTAERTASPHYLRAALGPGWYPVERLPGRPVVWRWTSDDAVVDVDNPQSGSLRVAVGLDVSRLQSGEIQLWEDGRLVASRRSQRERWSFRFDPLEIPPGRHRLEIRPETPAALPGGADSRRLAFCVFHLDIQVLPDGP